MSVKAVIYDKQKKSEFTPEMRKLIRRACAAVIKSEGFTGNAQIDISIVDDEQIKAINAQFRNIDAATDVLSFPLGENGCYDVNPVTGAYMLGDVVLSLEHAIAQGMIYGHGTDREIAYLTVHSVLHLLGYDHINSDAEKKIMRGREEAALDILGLSITGENND